MENGELRPVSEAKELQKLEVHEMVESIFDGVIEEDITPHSAVLLVPGCDGEVISVVHGSVTKASMVNMVFRLIKEASADVLDDNCSCRDCRAFMAIQAILLLAQDDEDFEDEDDDSGSELEPA